VVGWWGSGVGSSWGLVRYLFCGIVDLVPNGHICSMKTVQDSPTIVTDCIVRQLLFNKDKKCCKNWKHDKRCKKCPKK
jgi:hypothetical protein